KVAAEILFLASPLAIIVFTTVKARADASSQFDGYFEVLIGTLSVWPSIWNFLFGIEANTFEISWIFFKPCSESVDEPDGNRISEPKTTTIRPSTILTLNFPV